MPAIRTMWSASISLGNAADAVMFVFVPAGAIAFTRSGFLRYSTARDRVSCTTPPFVMQYTAEYGTPWRPAFDAMLTMLPVASSRCGIAACARKK